MSKLINIIKIKQKNIKYLSIKYLISFKNKPMKKNITNDNNADLLPTQKIEIETIIKKKFTK
jgi:hypothetical protein